MLWITKVILMSDQQPSSNTAAKDGMDVYDYIFNLEERTRSLQTEKQLAATRAQQLEQEVARLRQEVNELRSPPLVVGTIQEVMNDIVIIRNSTGVEFLIRAGPELLPKLSAGLRVGLTQRSLSIVDVLPESKDYRAQAMEILERPSITFEQIGGLKDVTRELHETVILPLIEPERFAALGIIPPNGILLHGVPGVGKTLLAKAVANQTDATFIGVNASEFVRKYIGEGSKIVRDVFKIAHERKHAIIFIDELDAIGAHRMDDQSGGDREVQRTLMQLLAELDGFKDKKNVKIIAATNRIDILDPALLRPGRFDRIIEVDLPDEEGRLQILKIHTQGMKLDKKVALESIAALTDGASGAELKAVCTEAGMFALRVQAKTISMSDFKQAVDKVLTQKQEANDSPAEKNMWA